MAMLLTIPKWLLQPTSSLASYSLSEISTWMSNRYLRLHISQMNSSLPKPVLITAFRIPVYANSSSQLLQPKNLESFGIIFYSWQSIKKSYELYIQNISSIGPFLTISIASTPWSKLLSPLAWTTAIGFSQVSFGLFSIKTPLWYHSNMTNHVILLKTLQWFPYFTKSQSQSHNYYSKPYIL